MFKALDLLSLAINPDIKANSSSMQKWFGREVSGEKMWKRISSVKNILRQVSENCNLLKVPTGRESGI